MFLSKQKKSQGDKGNRLLVSVTVMGSAGPIRFVVNEKELVGNVIDTVLKCYAREGRLPILGSKIDHFVLYSPIAGTEALSPWDTIGSFGVRNFMMCKKPGVDKELEQDATATITRKGSGSWKAWFNKSLNLKISSH
ncbi:GRAS family transcription factor family protein [Heracleum sosnowskyi]|uniref:GRAS family transcription factor family protein n=1 Tax=Heracleum sosnowskyi TaxID=360622 RepID=A0AAD8IKW9_9APIA|nr:GRAS family transcription factor family protein [Heracleum sosnowskyi]